MSTALSASLDLKSQHPFYRTCAFVYSSTYLSLNPSFYPSTSGNHSHLYPSARLSPYSTISFTRSWDVSSRAYLHYYSVHRLALHVICSALQIILLYRLLLLIIYHPTSHISWPESQQLLVMQKFCFYSSTNPDPTDRVFGAAHHPYYILLHIHHPIPSHYSFETASCPLEITYMSTRQSTNFLHHLFEAGNSLFVQLLIPSQVYHHTSNNSWPESQHMFITPSNNYLYHPSTTQPFGCAPYPNYVTSTQTCIRPQPNSLHHLFVQKYIPLLVHNFSTSPFIDFYSSTFSPPNHNHFTVHLLLHI